MDQPRRETHKMPAKTKGKSTRGRKPAAKKAVSASNNGKPQGRSRDLGRYQAFIEWLDENDLNDSGLTAENVVTIRSNYKTFLKSDKLTELKQERADEAAARREEREAAREEREAKKAERAEKRAAKKSRPAKKKAAKKSAAAKSAPKSRRSTKKAAASKKSKAADAPF